MKRRIFVFISIWLFMLAFAGNVLAEVDANHRLTLEGDTWRSPVEDGFRPAPREASEQEAQDLPERYDLRDVDGRSYLTPVKNQAMFGTCWAFAATSVAETSSMLKGGPSDVDLSEKALAWYTYRLQGAKGTPEEEYEGMNPLSYDTTYQFDQDSLIYNNGGNSYTANSQMSTWNGASTEADIPYTNASGEYVVNNVFQSFASPYGDWTLPYESIYQNAYHLQDATTLLSPNSDETLTVEDFTAAAKSEMLRSGALVSSYYAATEEPYYNPETCAQYIDTPSSSNHQVAIIGWDDSFPASSFLIQPPGDGAWLVRNSWGPEFGEGGYFHLSYYDQSMQWVQSMDVETAQTGFSYDKNYQYDYLATKGGYIGDVYDNYVNDLGLRGMSPGDIKTANVFTTSKNETLRAVSFTAPTNASYAVTAKVYILNDNYQSPEDGRLVATASGSYSLGFHTMALDSPVALPESTAYSVVEEITATTLNEGGQEETYPCFSVEVGMEEPTLERLYDQESNVVGFSMRMYTAKAQPGESYVYGLNGTPGSTPPAWVDVTDPDVRGKLAIDYEFMSHTDGTTTMNRTVPGNAMIKAYTTYGIGEESNFPTSISLSRSAVNMTTSEDGVNTGKLAVATVPSDAASRYEWTASPANVVAILTDDPEFAESGGRVATLKALAEGEATVTCTSENGLAAVCRVKVADGLLVADGVDFVGYSPDYYNVIVRNVVPNPALESGAPPTSVSVFNFSQADHSDISAKFATRIPGTNDWVCERVPVNDVGANNYFVDADHIQVHVYASGIPNSPGGLVTAGEYSWVTPGVVEESANAYIAYCQNVGFVRPTVWYGESAGLTDDPDSSHMEGFRLSSALFGLEITSEAYAQGLGWLPEARDGVYCGTMNENRAIQAIRLRVDGVLSALAGVTYRVYLRDGGWTDWVDGGEVCGAPGSDNAIQAIEVKLNNETSL